MNSSPPVALTIAGFDTSCGAGLQADLLTFHHHGLHPLTAATTLVAETPLQVVELAPVSTAFLQQQVALLLETYAVQVVKIGLLANADQAAALATLLAPLRVPIVLDPVGIASTGDSLQSPETAKALLTHLAPLSLLMTPNLPEARQLAGRDDLAPADLALHLAETTGQAMLLTGGHHRAQGEVTDLLAFEGQIHRFVSPEIETEASLHGTGCVLSSAIAAQLALGSSLLEAVERGRHYLRQALAHHHEFPHPSRPLLALRHSPSEATTND
ncbi:MAG: hydroxymethylpyrimidine/phosphomethylpyrimidine kinase [Verrucomicrobiota bacterium JB023]|nr:hydroxymethylpyrimidine/phosphomethylpyrimidine kinase [Verrucomicrobiota bacterium JB023]